VDDRKVVTNLESGCRIFKWIYRFTFRGLLNQQNPQLLSASPIIFGNQFFPMLNEHTHVYKFWIR